MVRMPDLAGSVHEGRGAACYRGRGEEREWGGGMKQPSPHPHPHRRPTALAAPAIGPGTPDGLCQGQLTCPCIRPPGQVTGGLGTAASPWRSAGDQTLCSGKGTGAGCNGKGATGTPPCPASNDIRGYSAAMGNRVGLQGAPEERNTRAQPQGSAEGEKMRWKDG